MNTNKKLLASAVGASLVFGAGAANAFFDADYPTILFPYVVKDTNRTTVVTIIGDGGQPAAGGTSVHLQYWTKSTTAANTAACEPNSSTMTFTDNDIVSFDTAGLFAPGALFGDVTNSAPLGTSISYAAPRHGYLLVEWTTAFPLAGYWLEIDLGNGGAHGDWALRAVDGDNFTLAEDHVSLVVGDIYTNSVFGGAHAVPFWPTSVASTVFTVTPLGSAMATVENNQVAMQVINYNNVQGAYDRNENGIDGTVPQTVRCVGRLTPAQLMPGVVANASWVASGGWGFLANLGDGDTNYTEGSPQDLPALVYQVDSSNAAGSGKFMQNATRIVSNNFEQATLPQASDIRLKRDIEPLGRLDNGLGLYRYRYNWSDQLYVGVMAQEVAQYDPAAVVRGPDGYLRVYYDRLGLKLQTWEEWVASTDFGQEINPVNLN